MNQQVMIIARRDPERLGLFHRPAAKVIESGRMIEVFPPKGDV